MKLCASCQNKYPDDANFCPREQCAGPDGPHRLDPIVESASRFVPVSRIGGGASGEVWQASDAQSGNAVAYKLVATEALPNPLAVDRALRELRQLQRANNPRIVKVIDFGKTPEGQVYAASELVGGEPLDQVVGRSGPFALDRAKHVIAQVGEALLDAQKVGVVHRDLSAKNILVTGDGDVKVINFAIPRPVSATVFGVPAFMSPEQAEGKLIDQRSNTYGVAAVLYFMLTGQPPVSGETPDATLQAVLKGEIVPPSIRRGSGLNADVDRVVMKALERNSSRRPLTMRQFLADVAALVVGDQPSSAPSSMGANRDASFVKTMMFAGGATDVQKLVAQAVAARQAAGAPAAAAPEPAAATPAVVADSAGDSAPVAAPGEGKRPSGPSRHGSAVSATMIALPAAASASVGGAGAAPPAGAPKDSAAQTPGPSGQGGANFRETLWFKKGDVDQMVADARAKVAAMADAKKAEVAGASTIDLPPGGTDEVKPLEDRYVDDGTVTTDDRKNFSLDQSGATTTKAQPSRKVPIPGERMSDNEVIDEIGGGKRIKIILIAAAAALSLIVVVVMMVRGRGKPDVVQAPPAPAAAPAEPPAADKGTADEGAAAKADTRAAAKDEKGEGAEEAPRPAPRPAAAAKKKPAATAKKKPAPAAKKVHR
ncbi:MAG TPA: serine/threonine-protein kinase [Polyangia bacterium]|jgi:serine/threonine-protein kinase|nr:serine/threonine-protein kinase [Polyangia bacterium]